MPEDEPTAKRRRLSRRQFAALSASSAAAAGLAGIEASRPQRAQARGAARGTVDVAVVGAGLAGLTAARRIARAGRSVVVLEARNRVGGRTLDHRIGRGKVVELGGQWAGPGQNKVLHLAEELGIDTFETYSDGENLMYRNGQLTRWSGDIPPVNPASLAELELAIVQLNSMAADVPEKPWKAANATEWDSQTIETWIEANAHTDDARWLMGLVVEGVYGAEPADVSLLDLLSTIRGVGGDVFTLVGDAQSIRFVGGPQQLSKGLAARLGDRVVLRAPVHAIDRRDKTLRVVSGGGDWLARRAVVAVPPPLVDRIAFHPPLRPSRAQLAQRQPMGTAIKINAVYGKPFWREQGLNAFVISDTGPVKITYDNSPRDGKPGVLVGFFEGEDGSDFYDKPRRLRRRAALESLERYFGPEARHPKHYLELVWAAQPYTRGAYGAYNPPGVLTSIGHVAGRPTGRVHFAASELTSQWIGYMDGAIRSGARAADEILAALS